MDLIKLEENYSFAAAPVGKKVRLVAYLSGVEKVCRLETRKKLEKFLLSNENHLFKGRLQLAKNAGDLRILVKGEPVGIIACEKLIEMINHAGSTAVHNQYMMK